MYRAAVSTLFVAVFFMIATPCAADELDQIRKAGEISFSMSGQYPPFNFVNENNELAGFDVELCSEIARRIGVKPAPLTTAWDGIIAGLLAAKYDLICGSMAITEERLKAIDFSDPYYRSGAQLFVPKKSEVDSAQQLNGKKVGVTLGTTFEEWVRTNLPGVDVRTYKGVPDMILEVANGRIDGFITDRIVGAMAIDEKNAPIKLAGPLLYEEKMGIALAKDNPGLRSAINEALASMQNDGSYHDISMKWLKIDAR
ncbi:amino acid ABC transporter substrate-binding protein [Desulfuromonas versatilis]|uniref:Amino acid ABC transporter substrate-binding protein n=1 Tax=Desulfuromonas versatilis TaxID=2802975 RepID=A0ABM8HSW4_9BACT|nr:ABC transporter substrate-binding protein [Desulfuromonas versatilis]BCR03548.1 amino acid ABC transporter substrate-binding protein [Desulfuromonas versatilis]